jgi:gliding motility-associated-like protein
MITLGKLFIKFCFILLLSQCFWGLSIGQVVCKDSIQTIKYSSPLLIDTYTPNTTTFDGGLVFIEGLSNGTPNLDSFLLFKMDDNGKVIWSKIYILPTLGISACQIHEMHNGNILVYVTPDNSSSISELFIMFNSQGKMLWQKGYADFNNIGLITEAPNGDIVACVGYENENIYRFDSIGNYIAGYSYTHVDKHGMPLWDNFKFLYTPAAINMVGNSLYLQGIVYNYLLDTFVCSTVQKIDLATGKVLGTKNYQFNTTDGSSKHITIYPIGFSHKSFSAIANNHFLMSQNIQTDTSSYEYEYAFLQLDSSLNVISNPVDIYALNSNNNNSRYGFASYIVTNNDGLTVLTSHNSYAIIDTNINIIEQKTLSYGNISQQSLFNLQDNGILNICRAVQSSTSNRLGLYVTNTPPAYLSGVGCSGTTANVFGSFPLGYSTMPDSVVVTPYIPTSTTSQDFSSSLVDFKLDTLTTCKQISQCHTLKIIGGDTICVDGLPRTFTTHKNSECLKRASWNVSDTTFASILNQDDNRMTLNLKKSGQAYLYATIPSCGIKDSLLINGVGSSIIPFGDTSLCYGQQLMIQTSVFPINKTTYLWQDGTTKSFYNVSKQGVYKVIINTDGCISKDSINVVFHSSPNLYLAKDTLVCDIAEITLKPSNESRLKYLWDDGSTADSLVITKSGAYWVSATNEYRCTHSDSIKIKMEVTPKIDLGNDTVICYPQQLLLSAFVNNDSNVTYLWQDGSRNSQYLVTTSGLYKVTVTNDCGAATGSINVVESDCNLLVPNAFNSNNEVFKVSPYFSSKKFNMVVYDRYGKRVFEANNTSNGWDGTFNGVKQDVGTYVWLIQYINEENRNKTAHGTVVLMR